MKKSGSAGVPLKALYALALARISLGLIFLWAFFDKLWGLGFATCRDPETDVVTTMCSKAWAEGGSPTTGFLKFATDGPFADFYRGLAGQAWVDWLFMLGLLAIGVALTFGIAVKLAAVAGSVLLLMMWTAVLPPENNPLIDDHVVYVFLLAAIAYLDGRQALGLGKKWRQLAIVKQNRWLN